MLTSNWTFNNWSNIYIYTYIELWCSPGHRHAEIHSTGTIPLRQAWSAWLQRQGLSRLLRHDSRGALRSDGVTTKAARLEIQNFRLKGMADGQAGSLMISGWRTPGYGWYFMIFNDIYIYYANGTTWVEKMWSMIDRINSRQHNTACWYQRI